MKVACMCWVAGWSVLVSGCGEQAEDEFSFPEDMCPGVAARADLVMCTVRTDTLASTDPAYAFARTSTYDAWGMRDSTVVDDVLAYEAERDERGRLIREERQGSYGWQTTTFGWEGCDGGTRRFQDDTADASGPFTWRNGVVASWKMDNTVPGQWGTQTYRSTWEQNDVVFVEQTLDGQVVFSSTYAYQAVDGGTRVTEERAYGGLATIVERFVREYDDVGRQVLYEHDRNADGVVDSRRTTSYTDAQVVEETDGDADGVVDWSVVLDLDDASRVIAEHMRWTDASGPQERQLELTWDCP